MAPQSQHAFMNKQTLKWLAAAVVLLVGVLFVIDSSDRYESMGEGDALIPELKSQLNDIQKITITRSGDDVALTIVRDGDIWLVSDRDDYRADVSKIRSVPSHRSSRSCRSRGRGRCSGYGASLNRGSARPP